MRAALLGFVFLSLALGVRAGRAADVSEGSAHSRQTKRIVFAVGINEYAYTRSASDDPAQGWEPLRLAETDARDLVAALAPFGFEPYAGTPLLSERATAGNILKRLKALAQEMEHNKTTRYEVVLYFSQHGIELKRDGEKQAHLVAYDTPALADLQKPEDVPLTSALVLSQRAIHRLIEKFGSNVDNVAVIYDACQVPSGKGPPDTLKGAPPARDVAAEVIARRRVYATINRATLIFAAVSGDQRAIERRDLGNSIYTHHLIGGLRDKAKAQRQSGLEGHPFSLLAAHLYAQRRTRRDTNHSQSPTWSAPRVNQGFGFFYLDKPKHAPQVATVLIPPPWTHAYELVSARNPSVTYKGASPQTGAQGVLTANAAGRYLLRVRDEPGGSVLLERPVDLALGDVSTIDVFERLDLRAKHRVGVSAGVNAPRSAWGAETGFIAQPTLGVGYLLDGWPGPHHELAIGVEAGTASRAGLDGLYARDSLFSGHLSWGWGMPVGLLRITTGPIIEAAAIRRQIAGLGEDNWSSLWGGGLRLQLSVPLWAGLRFRLDGRGTANAVAEGDAGVYQVRALAGLDYTWAAVGL